MNSKAEFEGFDIWSHIKHDCNLLLNTQRHDACKNDNKQIMKDCQEKSLQEKINELAKKQFLENVYYEIHKFFAVDSQQIAPHLRDEVCYKFMQIKYKDFCREDIDIMQKMINFDIIKKSTPYMERMWCHHKELMVEHNYPISRKCKIQIVLEQIDNYIHNGQKHLTDNMIYDYMKSKYDMINLTRTEYRDINNEMMLKLGCCLRSRALYKKYQPEIRMQSIHAKIFKEQINELH